jgi:CheY-like chemotaxis protein
MGLNKQERILVVDTNPLFCARLIQDLGAAGYLVENANTGEEAFLLLRDRQHPIDWLYARAALPTLIDGWILADEYHDTHPRRAAVLAVSSTRASEQGDILVQEPTPEAVVQALQHVIGASERSQTTIAVNLGEQRYAA